MSCAIYLRATQEEMASRFVSVTSEEIIQINFFLVYIISLFQYLLKQLFTSVSVASVFTASHLHFRRWIVVNYSLENGFVLLALPSLILLLCSYCSSFLRVCVYKPKYRVNRTNHKKQRSRDFLNRMYMLQTKQFEANERWYTIWHPSVTLQIMLPLMARRRLHPQTAV